MEAGTRARLVPALALATILTTALGLLTPLPSVREAGPDARGYLDLARGTRGAEDLGVFVLRPLHPWLLRHLEPALAPRPLALLISFLVLVALGLLARGDRWAVALAIVPAAASFAVTYPVWNVYVADGLRNLLLVALLLCAARWPCNGVVTVALTLTHPSAVTGVSGATASAWFDGRRGWRTLLTPWAALVVTSVAATLWFGVGAELGGAYGEDVLVAWRSFGAGIVVKLLPAVPAVALAAAALLVDRHRARRLWVAGAMVPGVVFALLVTSDVARALAPLLLVVPALAAEALSVLPRTRWYVVGASAASLAVLAARVELPSGSGPLLYGVLLGVVPVVLAWRERPDRSAGVDPLAVDRTPSP